jgi:hypothetical protein
VACGLASDDAPQNAKHRRISVRERSQIQAAIIATSQYSFTKPQVRSVVRNRSSTIFAAGDRIGVTPLDMGNVLAPEGPL